MFSEFKRQKSSHKDAETSSAHYSNANHKNNLRASNIQSPTQQSSRTGDGGVFGRKSPTNRGRGMENFRSKLPESSPTTGKNESKLLIGLSSHFI